MMKETGWQQHSVRGFLAGVVRKRLKLNLLSDATNDGRVYRIGGKRPAARKGRRQNALPDHASAAQKHSIDEEIAHLRDLDLKGLHARWRAAFRKVAPPHLPRHLLFGILAYRSRPTNSVTSILRQGEHSSKQPRHPISQAGADRLEVLDRQQSRSEPGTVLMREWKGRQHRVVVWPTALRGTARPIGASPQSPSPSPAPDGMAPVSLACGRTGGRE